MNYRKEIDGLRALAIVPVVLFHAGISSFNGGYVGVDVFYVISGYLITSIILLECKNESFKIISFWERRARRILPGMFFIFFACLPFVWMYLSPHDLKYFSKSLVAACFSVSNFLFWRTSGYFDNFSDLNPLLHTWSLGVEEQFYLVFPVFFVFLFRLGLRPLIGIILIIAIASLLLAQWFVGSHSSAAFYLLPFRAWELLIGSLSALYSILILKQGKSTVGREILSVLGLFSIVISIFCFQSNTPVPSIYTLLPTLGTALVLLHASSETIVGRILAAKVLVVIGVASYSLYLWHQPVFALARHLGVKESEKATYLVLSSLSVVLALFTSHFVEKPFRDRSKVSSRRFGLIFSVFFLILLILGILGIKTEGFAKIKATPIQEEVLNTAKSSPKRKECHAGINKLIEAKDACEYVSGHLRVATFGDSHTVELAYALSQELALVGVKLKHFSFSGCVPVWGVTMTKEMESCAKWTKKSVEYISESKYINTVVVSYRINAALNGGHEKIYPDIPSEVDDDEKMRRWDAYIRIIQQFVRSGKQVVLILQAPELPQRIHNLVYSSNDPLGAIRGVSTKWWNERSKFLVSRIGEIPEGVIILDPASLLCDVDYCYAANKGVAYYFDDDHLSVEGARIVARRMLEKITISNMSEVTKN